MRENEVDSPCGNGEDNTAQEIMEALCQELNMDEQTADEAMQNFTAVWDTYTLEVREIRHKLASSPHLWCLLTT